MINWKKEMCWFAEDMSLQTHWRWIDFVWRSPFQNGCWHLNVFLSEYMTSTMFRNNLHVPCVGRRWQDIVTLFGVVDAHVDNPTLKAFSFKFLISLAILIILFVLYQLWLHNFEFYSLICHFQHISMQTCQIENIWGMVRIARIYQKTKYTDWPKTFVMNDEYQASPPATEMMTMCLYYFTHRLVFVKHAPKIILAGTSVRCRYYLKRLRVFTKH